MIDVESAILEELGQLAPLEHMARDWQNALDRAQQSVGKTHPTPARHYARSPRHSPRRTQRGRRWRISAAAIAATVVAIVPAVALSASVRGFFGLERFVEPKYQQARLVVSAALPGDRVARLWVAPSTQGGECEFVTYERVGSKPKASRMDGGGDCTIGTHKFLGTLSWAFSSASYTTPPVIRGRASEAIHPARVELRWHGGSRALVSEHGYFIGMAPELNSPPFRQLPYDLVVLDSNGRVRARSRIPTSFLYVQWKQVQPQLHAYRVAHGCDRKQIWSCKSR